MAVLPDLLHDWILSPLRALAFPPLCPACGRTLADDSPALCPGCQELLEAARLSAEALRRLRFSVRGDDALDDLLVHAYFERNSPLQALIHRLKYQGGVAVGRNLGVQLGGLLARELSGSTCTGLIPVPLHRARLRERGYNQAAVIAEGVRSVLPLPLLDALLVRPRATETQTGLAAAARRRNVAGAFSVRAGAEALVYGGTFLILDDVVTTGATLEACARTLKASGAARCVGGAVALAR